MQSIACNTMVAIFVAFSAFAATTALELSVAPKVLVGFGGTWAEDFRSEPKKGQEPELGEICSNKNVFCKPAVEPKKGEFLMDYKHTFSYMESNSGEQGQFRGSQSECMKQCGDGDDQVCPFIAFADGKPLANPYWCAVNDGLQPLNQRAGLVNKAYASVGRGGLPAVDAITWGEVSKYVVMANTEADVKTAVTDAVKRGFTVSARSGGHDYVASSIRGQVVIDLTCNNYNPVEQKKCELRQISFDSDACKRDGKNCTVTIGAGAKLGEIYSTLGQYGRAIPGGSCATVGIGGLTLGGGQGILDRQHGLVIDNLVSARIITANGELQTVSKDQNPDLFWAIRGGSSDFGVVTKFTFNTVETGKKGYVVYQYHGQVTSAESQNWDFLADRLTHMMQFITSEAGKKEAPYQWQNIQINGTKDTTVNDGKPGLPSVVITGLLDLDAAEEAGSNLTADNIIEHVDKNILKCEDSPCDVPDGFQFSSSMLTKHSVPWSPTDITKVTPTKENGYATDFVWGLFNGASTNLPHMWSSASFIGKDPFSKKTFIKIAEAMVNTGGQCLFDTFGGAINVNPATKKQRASDETAFPHRERNFAIQFTSTFHRSKDFMLIQQWIYGYMNAIDLPNGKTVATEATGPMYRNYTPSVYLAQMLTGDGNGSGPNHLATEEEAKEAMLKRFYEGNLTRLRLVKCNVDPKGHFSTSQYTVGTKECK